MKERIDLPELVSTMAYILDQEALEVDCKALRDFIAPITNSPTFVHEYTDGFVVSKCGRCDLTAGIIHKQQAIEDLVKIEIQHRCNGKRI